MRLSDRINSVEESQTVQFTQLLQQLRRQGREIINLAVGEPQLNVPIQVIESTKRALDDGMTRYGTVSGLHELKSGLARQFDGYNDNNIIISNGSKQCLFSIFQVICNPSDEVIIPSPYWVSFPQQVIIAGGKPVFVDVEPDTLCLDLKSAESAITPATKALIYVSLHGRCGDMVAAKSLCKKHGLFFIEDAAQSLGSYFHRDSRGAPEAGVVRPGVRPS